MNNDLRLLNSAISNFKSNNGIKRDKSLFDYFTTAQILKDKDIEFDDIDSCLVDGGNDGGIDVFAVLINDQLIQSTEELDELSTSFDKNTNLDVYLIQNKDKTSFSEDVYKTLIPTCKDALNYHKNDIELLKIYNLSLVEKILIMRRSIDAVMSVSNNFNFKIFYACKGDCSKISQGVKHKQDMLRTIILESISIPNLEITTLGANELRNLFINSPDDELIIQCDSQISFESDDESTAGYISTVKLDKYYEFVSKDKKVRDSILESNIRHYQGRVTVNNGIINTLQNDISTEFWWLNNGITILCSEIVPLPNKKLRLTDPQIVNGLQTTFCIAEYLSSNEVQDDNRTVLVKIIKIKDTKTIDKIISSTNSQTEVRAADLRATDELQRDIESYFLSQGYFYDRRKNYYKNLKKDRNKIFTIGKTAQFVETILFKKPHAARSNPTTLLKKDESYTRIFNKDINIDTYLKSCQIFKIIDSYIKEFDKETDLININFGASMKNFTFHLMLLSTILVVKKTDITDSDISNLSLSDINIGIMNNASRILYESLHELARTNQLENAISAAKAKTLTDTLLKKCNDTLTNS